MVLLKKARKITSVTYATAHHGPRFVTDLLNRQHVVLNGQDPVLLWRTDGAHDNSTCGAELSC